MKKLFLAMVILIICALVIGCGASTSNTAPLPAATSTTAPKSGGILKIGAPSESTALGRAEVGSPSADGLLSAPAIEQLRRIDEKGDFSPWLADSWKTDPQALTVTISLKKGIKFSDGTDLNAEAVKWNYDWLMQAKTSAVVKIKSVDIVDNYTLKLNLTEWGSDILHDVTGIGIVSPTAWKTNGDDWGKKNPVGTGPFKMASHEQDVNIKYVKNNDYWQKGKPYLDGIEFDFIKDPTTRMAAFKAGEIDICLDPTIGQAQEVNTDPKYVVQVGEGYGTSLMLCPDGQNQDSPFSKLQVRQAVAYAVDRKGLVDGVLGGYGLVSTQAYLPGSWPFNPNLTGYTYDPQKAKQLLSDAGYPNGFTASLNCGNMGSDPAICTALLDMLAKVNIKTDLNAMSTAAFMQTRTGGWKNGFVWAGVPANPNMVTWACNFTWTSKRTSNKSLLNAPEIDEVATQATTATDMAARQPVVWKLMDLLFYKYVQDIPVLVSDSLLLRYPYARDVNLYKVILLGEWHAETAWLDR